MTETPLHEIPVVILAGGMGTRFREETERIPKPLIPVGERPILWHIMKTYAHYGFRRFVLCLGYKSWSIKEYFLRYREQLADFTLRVGDQSAPILRNARGNEPWEVTFAETGLATATGGRLWRVRDYIDADTFLFTYGDGVGRIPVDQLVAFHRSHGLMGTVTAVRRPSRYGELILEGHRVREFQEKPTVSEDFVSGGYFVLQRGIFDYLRDDPNLVFELDPLQRLTRDGQLAAFRHDGYWLGMDTYREWQELEALWASGKAPWKVWND